MPDTLRKKTARHKELQEFLDEAYERLAVPGFVQDDPIRIPRSFSRKEDQECIGFLTATIAWGQRRTIINNARGLVDRMDGVPFDFIMQAEEQDLRRLDGFVHRTFNSTDLRSFVTGLRHLHNTYGGLESAFLLDGAVGKMDEAIDRFRTRFFEAAHQQRTEKHVASPARGSSAKRINMFLRWMVRPADHGVDLGIWHVIRPKDLLVPLDVHTGRVARELGLLQRKQDDQRSVQELTERLRTFDPDDPVKYDIALFGLGVEAQRKTTRLVPT